MMPRFSLLVEIRPAATVTNPTGRAPPLPRPQLPRPQLPQPRLPKPRPPLPRFCPPRPHRPVLHRRLRPPPFRRRQHPPQRRWRKSQRAVTPDRFSRLHVSQAPVISGKRDSPVVASMSPSSTPASRTYLALQRSFLALTFPSILATTT